MFRAMLSKRAKSTDKTDSWVDFHPLIANKAFVDALRTFNFLSDPVSVSLAGAQTQVSVFNFLPPPSAHVALQGLRTESLALVQTQLQDSKKTPEALAASTLYLKGRCEGIADVVATLANIRGVGLEMTADFEKSRLWTLLAPILDLLTGTMGKTWQNAVGDNPMVAACILNTVQTAMGRLVSQCKEQDYLTALKNGDPISTCIFTDTASILKNLLGDLRNSITSVIVGDKFKEWPTNVHSLLGKEIPSGGKHPPSSQDVSGGASKKPKHSPAGGGAKTDNPSSDKKKLGMLDYIGNDTKPPLIDVYTKKSGSNNPERLCSYFCIRGFECTLGPKCPRPHPAGLQGLPEAVQKKLVEFVNKNDKLKFAPGKGPAGK